MATHGQPLRVILLVRAKQRTKGVVSGDDESRNVGQELTAEVEDDQEEVERPQTKHGIGLGDRCLPLEVVERGVLGELRHRSVSIKHVWARESDPAFATHLFVELGDIVLNAVLGRRHGCGVE